jgi:hypothetical protein
MLMNIYGRKTRLPMFAAIFVAALATVRCGSESPTQPTTQAISSVALSASSGAAGTTVQGTVTLSAAAPTGGASVSLSSSNTAMATVPAAVTVAAGSSSAVFTVTTISAGTVTITASMSGNGKSATLTIGGAGLVSISLSAATVVGGNSVNGIVTLSSGAPAGGAVVSLSGDAPVTVPATVTVPAGSITATFTVATRAVTATVAATIRGSYAGGSASVVLSVGAPTVATASFGVSGTDTSDTCVVVNGGNNLECSFNGSTSTAPGTITAWDWTYAVGASTLSQTTTGPILTNPSISCGFLPPPPLPSGTSSSPLTVTLRIHDSLGNVSAIKVDSGARVLPVGLCGF